MKKCDFLSLFVCLLNWIEEDDLRISSEDEVYDACVRWLNHAPEQRKADFHKVKHQK